MIIEINELLKLTNLQRKKLINLASKKLIISCKSISTDGEFNALT